MHFHSQKGFSFIELVLVLSIVAIFIGTSVPFFKGISDENKQQKAIAHTAILKKAVELYFREYKIFPDNITRDLLQSKNRYINHTMKDPFKTDSSSIPQTYGYFLSKDKHYYIIYSRGINMKKDWTWDELSSTVYINNSDDIIVTNAKRINKK